jgi:hypothetical protein
MFKLEIHARTAQFGSDANCERLAVGYLLRQAVQEIMSGGSNRKLTDTGGHCVGSFEYGVGMINGPGSGFDQTNLRIKPAGEGGRVLPVPARTTESANRSA